jgi:hypothetical protein
MHQYTEDEVEFGQQMVFLAKIIETFKRLTNNDPRVVSIEKMVAAIEMPSREVQAKAPTAVSDLCVQLQFLGNALHALRMTPEISLEAALAVGKLSAGCDFIDQMFSQGPVDEEEAVRLLSYLCDTFIIPSAVEGKFPDGTADALSVYGHVMTVNDDRTVTFKTKGGIDLVSMPCTPESRPH